MNTKGVVRKTDAKGRIALPEDICRKLNITESQPFEVYTEGEDKIILKKISRCTEHDWEKAKRILLPIIPEFALLDADGKTRKSTGSVLFEDLEHFKYFCHCCV